MLAGGESHRITLAPKGLFSVDILFEFRWPTNKISLSIHPRGAVQSGWDFGSTPARTLRVQNRTHAKDGRWLGLWPDRLSALEIRSPARATC